MTPAQIWSLGYCYVENLPERRIKARGFGIVTLITAAELRLDVNGKPYPRHADIIGWPNGDKHNQLMAATKIANALDLAMDPRV